jgi:hypothetical protein
MYTLFARPDYNLLRRFYIFWGMTRCLQNDRKRQNFSPSSGNENCLFWLNTGSCEKVAASRK